jgi:quinol monooxygenase YgiN
MRQPSSEQLEQDMAGFVQIIEFQTSRIDEVLRLGEEMRGQRAEGTVRRITMTADRDRAHRYVTIAEFDSYESAMENSNRPETSEFAARMAELCDGPPKFSNLDVSQTWER